MYYIDKNQKDNIVKQAISESIIIEVGYDFCMELYESTLACVIKSGKHVVKHTVRFRDLMKEAAEGKEADSTEMSGIMTRGMLTSVVTTAVKTMATDGES